MYELSLLQRSAISFAVLVTFGVLVHDTKIDQAAALALSVPIIGMTMAAHATGFHDSSVDHTHVERSSFNHTAAGNARMKPRDDHRRYILVEHIGGDNTPDTHHLVLSPIAI